MTYPNRNNLRKAYAACLSFVFSAALLSAAPAATAQSDEGVRQFLGNMGRINTVDAVKGSILIRRHVVYNGDPLSISLRFARGARLVNAGLVDASIVIFTPDFPSDPVVLPVSHEASPLTRLLLHLPSVDISTLPAGQYQLGLILTVPGGDPLDISDWHNGLRGMVDVVGLRISDVPVPEDLDRNGMIDGDRNRDGFRDEDRDDDVSGTD